MYDHRRDLYLVTGEALHRLLTGELPRSAVQAPFDLDAHATPRVERAVRQRDDHWIALGLVAFAALAALVTIAAVIAHG